MAEGGRERKEGPGIQIEMTIQCSKNTVIRRVHSAEGTQRKQWFILIRGIREAFIEEVTFDLGFEGCVGVHR